MLLGACGSSAPPRTTLPATHGDPVSMFSPGAVLKTDPTGTLAQLKRLGVNRVRLFVTWGEVAPDSASPHTPTFDATDPAAYPPVGWAALDTVVRDAVAAHVVPNLVLGGPPPRWAAGKGAPAPAVTHPYWKPNATEFEQFVAAVGKRYSGSYTPPGSSAPLPRIGLWSVWNEPNLGSNLAPEMKRSYSSVEVAPRYYRRLVEAAWTALHATGHGRDTILIGELGPAGSHAAGAPGLFAAMAPLQFLRALYCVDANYQQLRGAAASARGCPTTPAGSARFTTRNPALFQATGFADHPYSFTSLPPNQRTPNEPDDTEMAAMSTLEATLDRLQRAYGSDKRFPIWSTEFGYITNPPNPQYTVSPALAAQYINWAEYLSWRDPRIRSYDQFLLADAQGQEFATGLQTSTGAKKPTYDAYRMPLFLPRTTAPTGSALEVWGDVRPAKFVHKGKGAAAEVQFRSRAAAAWKTIVNVGSLSPQGYFDVLATFPGSGFVRTRWVYPDGEAVTSRTVAIALH